MIGGMKRDVGMVQYSPSCVGVFTHSTKSCGISPQLPVTYTNLGEGDGRIRRRAAFENARCGDAYEEFAGGESPSLDRSTMCGLIATAISPTANVKLARLG